MITTLPQNTPTVYAGNTQQNKTAPKRIYCYSCNEYTDAVEPITVRRYSPTKFHIRAICDRCKKFKSCVIGDYYRVKFPSYFFDMRKNEIAINDLQGKKIITEISHLINE